MGHNIPDEEELIIRQGKHLSAAVMLTDISGFSESPSADFFEQSDVRTGVNLYMSESIRG